MEAKRNASNKAVNSQLELEISRLGVKHTMIVKQVFRGYRLVVWSAVSSLEAKPDASNNNDLESNKLMMIF